MREISDLEVAMDDALELIICLQRTDTPSPQPIYSSLTNRSAMTKAEVKACCACSKRSCSHNSPSHSHHSNALTHKPSLTQSEALSSLPHTSSLSCKGVARSRNRPSHPSVGIDSHSLRRVAKCQ